MNKIKMLGIGAVIVTAIGAVCTAISKKGYAEGFRDGVENANDDFDMEILSELGEMNYKYCSLCQNYDELSSELKQANFTRAFLTPMIRTILNESFKPV